METATLDDHKQSCGSASVKEKRACVIPNASKFATGKTEYPPMHNGEFDTSQTKTTLQHTLSMHYSVVIGCAAYL